MSWWEQVLIGSGVIVAANVALMLWLYMRDRFLSRRALTPRQMREIIATSLCSQDEE
jgi:hypothetical protein